MPRQTDDVHNAASKKDAVGIEAKIDRGKTLDGKINNGLNSQVRNDIPRATEGIKTDKSDVTASSQDGKQKYEAVEHSKTVYAQKMQKQGTDGNARSKPQNTVFTSEKEMTDRGYNASENDTKPLTDSTENRKTGLKTRLDEVFEETKPDESSRSFKVPREKLKCRQHTNNDSKISSKIQQSKFISSKKASGIQTGIDRRVERLNKEFKAEKPIAFSSADRSFGNGDKGKTLKPTEYKLAKKYWRKARKPSAQAEMSAHLEKNTTGQRKSKIQSRIYYNDEIVHGDKPRLKTKRQKERSLVKSLKTKTIKFEKGSVPPKKLKVKRDILRKYMKKRWGKSHKARKILRTAAVVTVTAGRTVKKVGSLGAKAGTFVTEQSCNVLGMNRSENTDSTDNTGAESMRMLYSIGSKTKTAQNELSKIKTGIKRTVGNKRRAAPPRPESKLKTGRVIRKSAVKNVGKNMQMAKKSAKAAKKAAKTAQKAAKKAAQNIKKAVEITVKLIAKTAAFVITHLPIILVIGLVIVVIAVIVSGTSVVVSTVTSGVNGLLSWAFPSEEGKTDAESVAEQLLEYEEAMKNGFDDILDEKLAMASEYLTEDDDYYAAVTDNQFNDWIAYMGGAGEDIARDVLKDAIDNVDKSEFYALLFVYLQKQKNIEDGNDSYDIYDITFTEGEIRSFLYNYFDISLSMVSGLDCPGQSCHNKRCENAVSCPNRVGHPVTDPETGEVHVGYSCPGHPYCDHEHKKSTIKITRNANIMDDLGFTDEEKQRTELAQQLYDSEIQGNILGGGSSTEEGDGD